MTTATTLAGKTALVTGAASGIGLACAERFVREGAVVIATDVANDGAEIAERIGAEWRRLDVADPTDWDYLTASVANDHGRLDLVHLNAGIRLGASDVSVTPVVDYLRLIGINQHGVFLGLRATIPLLEAAGGGTVVVTASRAGIAPLPNDIPYVMAKHAIVGLVRSAADDLAARSISINAICPGTVDTGFLEGVSREQLEALGIAVMDPNDVADGLMAVLASGTTGACFVQPPGSMPEPFKFAELPLS